MQQATPDVLLEARGPGLQPFGGLARGARVEARTIEGRTPLYIAAMLPQGYVVVGESGRRGLLRGWRGTGRRP